MRGCRDNTHYEIGMHVHWAIASGYITCVLVQFPRIPGMLTIEIIDTAPSRRAVSFCFRVYANEIQRAASAVLCRKQTIALKYTALL